MALKTSTVLAICALLGGGAALLIFSDKLGIGEGPSVNAPPENAPARTKEPELSAAERAAIDKFAALKDADARAAYLDWAADQDWARPTTGLLRKAMTTDGDEAVRIRAFKLSLDLTRKDGDPWRMEDVLRAGMNSEKLGLAQTALATTRDEARRIQLDARASALAAHADASHPDALPHVAPETMGERPFSPGMSPHSELAPPDPAARLNPHLDNPHGPRVATPGADPMGAFPRAPLDQPQPPHALAGLVPDLLAIASSGREDAFVALDALAFIATPEAKARVLSVASDEEAAPATRARAVALLHQTRDTNALPLLRRLAASGDPVLAPPAREALKAYE